MVPRPATPFGSAVVQEVLADYHQSLPGERKSLSRQGSRRGSFSTQPGQQNLSGPPQHQSNLSQGQGLARPPSTGHAGSVRMVHEVTVLNRNPEDQVLRLVV